MRHLVIGGDSRLGSALVTLLRERGEHVVFTTRQPLNTFRIADNPFDIKFVKDVVYLDLEHPNVASLPEADVTYLVAAIPSTIMCEREPALTWRVNVDAPIAIARWVAHYGAFVFVSSDAVEFCGHLEYGRQKAQVEAAIAMHPRCVVFRPSRFTEKNVGEAAAALADSVTGRLEGALVRWP